MSEEEKKAIERAKEILKEWQKIVDIEDDTEREIEMTLYAEDMPFNVLKTLVKLVEQLEKENKKLIEARNWYFEHTVNKAVTPEMLHKILREDYVPKSMIRAKIEELEIDKKTFKYNEEISTDIEEKVFWHSQFKEMVIAISVLKELLGEE